MDTIYKTFKATIKEVKPETGEIEMMIPLSTNSIDRDGEVIEPAAFKKVIPRFMKHPVLVASHNYGDLTKQIGEWTKLRITENGLEGRPKYYVNEGNPEADWAFNLASKGRAAFSVGFIPDLDSIEEGDGRKTPRRTYKNLADLLEISQCIIPSNREAIQTIRAKSVGDKVITDLCNEVEKDLSGLDNPYLSPEYKAKLEKDLTSETLPPPVETVTKPEETDEFIRIPVRECKVTATIPISETEGIQALYCGAEKKVRTYLFRKDKGWTMEKAQAWVEKHDHKSLEDLLSIGIEIENKPKNVSQNAIIDEIDYLSLMIEESGMNDKVKESLQGLANKYLPKSIPEKIIEAFTKEDVKPVDDTTVKKNDIEPVTQKVTIVPEKDTQDLEMLRNYCEIKFGGK